MCELYAAQQLETPNATTDWQAWAAGLKAIDVFASEAVPSPYGYQDWQEWAASVLNAVNPAVA
jgi:hypothetical protein